MKRSVSSPAFHVDFLGDNNSIFENNKEAKDKKERYYRPSRAKSLRNEIDLEFSPIFPSIFQIFWAI